MSHTVTGVVDRNAPDVVVMFCDAFFQTPHDFINKHTTTDGYETRKSMGKPYQVFYQATNDRDCVTGLGRHYV